MKVRLSKKEYILNKNVIDETDKDNNPTKWHREPEIRNVYKIEYEVKEHNIFGYVKRKYWRTFKSTKDKEKAEEVYNWVIENETIGTATKTIKEDTINYG